MEEKQNVISSPHKSLQMGMISINAHGFFDPEPQNKLFWSQKGLLGRGENRKKFATSAYVS